MKTFNYSERNIWQTYLVLMPYLLFWIIGLVWYFGGVIPLINTISNYGIKLNVFIFSIVFFAPLFYIIHLINPKIELVIKEDNIYFRKKNGLNKVVPISNIAKIIQNETDMNSLNFYDKSNSKIISIMPSTNNSVLTDNILEAVSKYVNFKTTKIPKKIFGSSYATIIYEKK